MFVTIPATYPATNGNTTWSLYGVSKTATNTTPSPIYSITSTSNNFTGTLVATDSLVIAEPYTAGPGGKYSTIVSCNPANCANTAEYWYSSSGSLNVCDPVAQECFTQVQNGSFAAEVKYALLGTPSQTTAADFSPVLDIAYNGISAASGGYLYSTGTFSTSQQWPVLERVSENGTGGIVTLANFNQTSGNTLLGPVVVTGTQVFMMGYDASLGVSGVMSVPLPNGVGNAAPASLAKFGPGQFQTYWADDNNLVFQSAALQWVSCPATGCVGTPKVLADASQAEGYVVGDAQAIYWINSTTNATSLMKVAR